jgi:hypothetical protein
MNQSRVLVARWATFGVPWMSWWLTGGFRSTLLPGVSYYTTELTFWYITYTRRTSCDRSIASSKASCPQTAICYCMIPFPVSSRFLKVIQSLLTSYSSSSRHFYLSIFPSVTCFRRQFLPKIWPIQLAFLLLLYVWYSSPPSLFVILLYFSHDRSNWSSPAPHFNSFTVFLISFTINRTVWHKRN